MTTQNATITTAAVEVKTLTISGKQVTLAVFRQLREARLIADDGSLNGEPWGYVNHCPEKKLPYNDGSGQSFDCADSDHRHVIWQKDAELFRSRVTPPRPWSPPFWSDWSDTVAQATYCANSHTLPPTMKPVMRDGYRAHDFPHNGLMCTASAALERSGRNDHTCWTAEDLEAASTALSAEIAAERAARIRRREAWAAVVALPQLFIAV